MSKSQKKAVAKSGPSKVTKSSKVAKAALGSSKAVKPAKVAVRPAAPNPTKPLGKQTGSKLATPTKSKSTLKVQNKDRVKGAKAAGSGAKAVLTKAIKGIFGHGQKESEKSAGKATSKAAAASAPSADKKGKSSAPSKAELNKTLRATTLSLGKQSGRHSLLDSDSVCREVACEGLATTGGYCRMHYIKNWKKIKRKEVILKEGKLNQYIEELVAKYPDKYIEAIRSDLAEDKSFAKVVYDLELDESIDDLDSDLDSAEALIDTIKRDFEDDGDGF